MAISYGFFNSISQDRRYNADQISEYFDGLVSNGIYENVGSAMQVTAGEGMAVNVMSGRAIIDCKWIKNDAAQTIQLAAAHVLMPRYTAIVIRLDRANRMIEIAAKDGAPATNPAKPAMTNDGTITELCLAYVYVGANAQSVTQANITDMRSSSLCGWVTGVVKQVDTSELFAQYQAAFEENEAQQQAWMDSMQSEFDTWFSTLTQQLGVNTYVQKYAKRAVLEGSTTQISVTEDGYAYSEGDIIEAFINGLYASEGIDYTLTISGTTPVITPTATEAGTVVNIVIYKSIIGLSAMRTSSGAMVVTNNNQVISV